jgi:hypothetical protein
MTKDDQELWPSFDKGRIWYKITGVGGWWAGGPMQLKLQKVKFKMGGNALSAWRRAQVL